MGTPSLVGREDELRRLVRVREEAFAGIGRVVLISGEPGVGKTRLALELLGDAEREGARCAVGACWDGAGAPGLWPWVQILRTLRAALGGEVWAGGRGPGRDALTRLLDTEGGTASAEFHLFEATLQLLTDVCDERPLVVLLDDLQWADSTSIALVQFLHRHAVHLRLLVLGTYRGDEVGRPDHPQRSLIADLAQTAIAVPLAGLGNDGIRRLRGDLGVPTSLGEAEHLRRLTGGNPFFVIESTAFSNPAESLGVRRAIDRRVDALGDTERRALTVASLIGREAPDALIAAVVGDGATAALETIERAALMRTAAGRHVFVHDLVRETMRARLAPEDRGALCASIVRAAEQADLSGCLLPAQLAWLAARAVPDIDAEHAVVLLEAAASDASARLTHEAAGRHLDQAAALTGDADRRARLTLASGDAYRLAGELQLARDRYARLLSTTAVETRARALLGLHRLGDRAATAESPDVVRQLDEVGSALEGSDDRALQAEVLAARSRSRAHLLADDRATGVQMAADALDLARSSGDATTVASCLLAFHDAIWEPGTEVERRALADELAQTGRGLADLAVEAQGLLLRMVAEIETGDSAYLSTHREFDATAERSRSPRLQFIAASRRGMLSTLRADLPGALAEIDAARALGDRIGEPDAFGMWCDQRWQIARHAGDTDVVVDLMAALRQGGDPHWMVYEALIATELGDIDRARRLAPEIAALGERWPRWAARLWDAFNVQLALAEPDDAAAERLLERLKPDAAHWAVLGGGVLVYGPMSLWLGRLEAARGNWHAAQVRAAEAESSAERLDARLWAFEARADRLVAQHATGRVDAASLRSTSLSALDLGLVPIVERLRALSVASPSSANVFRRDRDVWTLVYEGVSATIPDAKGLRDLHTLLANPGVEVAATSMVTDSFVSTDTAPVLDAQAKESYRRRLDQLDRELERADARGDAGRAESAERERQALLDELRRAAGLGGRDRALGSDRERLRKTVTARIRDTLRRLDDRHPPLAAHLRASVRTGALCAYAPQEPVSWDLGL